MTPQQQKIFDFIRYHSYTTVFDICSAVNMKRDKVECRLRELGDQGLIESKMLFSEKLHRDLKHWKTI